MEDSSFPRRSEEVGSIVPNTIVIGEHSDMFIRHGSEHHLER